MNKYPICGCPFEIDIDADGDVFEMHQPNCCRKGVSAKRL